MSEDRYHLTEMSDTTTDMSEEEKKRRADSEMESLERQTTHLLLDFRMEYVEQHLKDLQRQISANSKDINVLRQLMQEYKQMQEIRNNLAKKLGNNLRC